MPDFSPVIAQAYLRILGRSPDPGGLAGWNRAMNDGLSEAAMREGLLRSPEYAGKHPDRAARARHAGGGGGGRTARATQEAAREGSPLAELSAMPDFSPVVADAYREILGRAPDPGGLAEWNRHMNAGLAEAAMREALLRSPEYAERHPDPSPAPALHVEGNVFVNALGAPVRLLGAIVCCADAKANGWPLVTLETLARFAAQSLNYTHCRLGPFTVAGEGDPGYVAYVTLADGRVDLERFHAPFWERCRAIAGRARELGIYVEFDLVDRWVRQHGASDLPAIDPWSARNNLQGLEAGGLEIFHEAPLPLHERFVRKAVAELGAFENTLFQIGNEGGKAWSDAWELGVLAVAKDELARRGYGDRLVATNTGDRAIEARVDYATRHDTRAQDPGPYPILVNEYPSIPPAEVERQVARAERLGTLFEYWRGDHDERQWTETLEALGRVARAGGVRAAPAAGTAGSRAPGAGRSARRAAGPV